VLRLRIESMVAGERCRAMSLLWLSGKRTSAPVVKAMMWERVVVCLQGCRLRTMYSVRALTQKERGAWR
jgi:hypothetical protein